MEYSDKQLQIIDAAEQLFGENGFDGTSVRDIAHEADVNIAMISYYFGSKDKLLEAVFEKRSASLLTQVSSLIENKKLSSLQKMNSLIEDYVVKVMKQPEFHKLMMRSEMVNKDNPIRELVYSIKKRDLEAISELIREGQEKKEFSMNIDIMMLMTTLIGTITHLMTTKHFYREMNHLEEMSETDLYQLMKQKLCHHLQIVFKAIVIYEA